jgi:diguanylate cyclase (GGDEF)-like protein
MTRLMSADRRRELVDELCAIVAAAERRGGPVHRVDQAVTRWCEAVPGPTDVLTLAADAWARLQDGSAQSSSLREEILERVERVGVAAVAQRLVREALTDPLTGLATRARLEDEVQHMLAVAARGSAPLTAVMIDVDGLKRINDEQGHQAGDDAIAEVGRAIREHARRSDRAFRWGGDEFVVFLPSTTTEEAWDVVARIQQSCSVATSAGVATHSGSARDTDIGAWLNRADAEMYRRRGQQRQAEQKRSWAPWPRLAGTAVLAVATVASSTVGWLGATSAAQTYGVAETAPQVQVTPRAAATTPTTTPAMTSATTPVAVLPTGAGRAVAQIRGTTPRGAAPRGAATTSRENDARAVRGAVPAVVPAVADVLPAVSPSPAPLPASLRTPPALLELERGSRR